MAELQRLHEARVEEEEIDHLGHMNIRFYQVKAREATRALAAAHGLTPSTCAEQGGVLHVRDAFTRHYQEQLVGAPLAVMGGLLEVRSDGFRAYHELVNVERDEPASVHVHEVALLERSTRRPIPLPEMFASGAGEARVDWPEHGRPRSLDLEQVPDALTLEVARERGLVSRLTRAVREDECDEDGFFVADRHLELLWGGEPVEGQHDGVPLFDMEGGGKFGWATLESRAVLLALPRAGDRIQSFGAAVDLARKTFCRTQWVFDVDSGALLCVHSAVNLAFDIGARRSIEIPAHVRTALEADCHPDLH